MESVRPQQRARHGVYQRYFLPASHSLSLHTISFHHRVTFCCVSLLLSPLAWSKGGNYGGGQGRRQGDENAGDAGADLQRRHSPAQGEVADKVGFVIFSICL